MTRALLAFLLCHSALLAQAQVKPIADVPAAPVAALPDVCGTIADTPVCVPASIFAATFKDWKDGDVSPLAREQAAHTETYIRWRNAEHELAKVRAELMKLAAPKETEGIDQVRANWLKSVQAAAPEGMVYDATVGKYVAKPPADPKPADKPKGSGG